MPKDGLYLLMPPDMSTVSQVLQPKKVKYDARKTKLPQLQKMGADIEMTVNRIPDMSPKAVAMARKAIFGK